MTSYHGGKNRIGKDLSYIIYDESILISKEEKRKIRGYCEPFCGMLGVYRHIPELFNDNKMMYKAGDINKSVIQMWKEIKKGWRPSNKLITKNKFMKLKYDGKSSAEKGFVGHFYGYMGKYFQPFDFRKTKMSLNNSINNVVSIGEKMRDVDFSSGKYKQFSSLKNYVIYCDPPYEKQSHYYKENGEHIDAFDHREFWEWCRQMSKNNIIFVSEYNAPKDFIKIWSIKSRTTGKSMIENLYTI